MITQAAGGEVPEAPAEERDPRAARGRSAFRSQVVLRSQGLGSERCAANLLRRGARGVRRGHGGERARERLGSGMTDEWDVVSQSKWVRLYEARPQDQGRNYGIAFV